MWKKKNQNNQNRPTFISQLEDCPQVFSLSTAGRDGSDALCSPDFASLGATLLLPGENARPALGFLLLLVQCSFAGGFCFFFSGFSLQSATTGWLFFFFLHMPKLSCLLTPVSVRWFDLACSCSCKLLISAAESCDQVKRIAPHLKCFTLI